MNKIEPRSKNSMLNAASMAGLAQKEYHLEDVVEAVNELIERANLQDNNHTCDKGPFHQAHMHNANETYTSFLKCPMCGKTGCNTKCIAPKVADHSEPRPDLRYAINILVSESLSRKRLGKSICHLAAFGSGKDGELASVDSLQEAIAILESAQNQKAK